MDRHTFKSLINERIIILDGATGTQMQKCGMPPGVCPESWAADNPSLLTQIQGEYIKAGSDIIYTFTLGGNRVKLDEYGLGERTVELNKKLAGISKEAAGDTKFVAGNISTTGMFVEPFGDLPFEDAVNVFKEQVRGLLQGGVDLFVIETMIDIQEARAALLAVKESCSLPVCVSMTFNEDGKTLMGTSAVTAAVTLQAMGADAVGCNCSTGPKEMLKIAGEMKAYARVPVMVKPNAGFPSLCNGNTVFGMDSDEFSGYVGPFADLGVNMIGGCCGTTPGYIKGIARELDGRKPAELKPRITGALTSARQTVFVDLDNPLTIIGERINPTGKRKLQDDLGKGSLAVVRKYAFEQVENGAKILDVNVGMSSIDEAKTMVKVVKMLAAEVDVPLCIDSSNPGVIEKALRIYPGRALVNSISGEREKLEKLLPVAAKYGAMFILLPLDDGGVPQKAKQRLEIIKRITEMAGKHGYGKEDIIADGLVMTVSSRQGAARETLDVIEWCGREFNMATVIGLSNVSFGLPERKWINSAFLAMAIDRGLTMAIANPSSEMLMSVKLASDVLTGRDEGSEQYIGSFVSNDKTGSNEGLEEKSSEEHVKDAVLKGNSDEILSYIKKVLKEGIDAKNIVDKCLIPAITLVGEYYEKKKYYLPQLIRSARAMKLGFEFLEPILQNESSETDEKKKVVIATVKGDIHDIGKNIVALMLKNYGFDVYDLGKDVPAEKIVEEAEKTGAGIVGLSALMTTTMVEMSNVIKMVRDRGLNCRIMVGGAVVNKVFADEIGADAYAPDAYEAVKKARELFQYNSKA